MKTNLSELFPYIAGIVLSLLFTYAPGLKVWYAKQSGYKALIMLGVLVVVAYGYYGLGCVPAMARMLNIIVPCTGDGALIVTLALFKIVLANQATYLLTKN
jgi:hypothetical protein